MSFQDLGLMAELLRAVAAQGYTEPTPVQREAIPAILAGRDMMAGAQTGSGKTAAFALPLLQRLAAGGPRPNSKAVRALILCPTRELAAQIHENVAAYGAHLPLKSAVVFGGVSINPQIAQLRRGVDVLIATPGRLLDHVSQNTVNLSQVEILVLDEADRMLDMGFIRDIRRVIAILPKRRQNLLFSATFAAEIRKLADGLLHDPAQVAVAAPNSAAERIDQRIFPVDRGRKRELLSYLIGSRNWRQVLVFTRTKHGANRLAEQLEQDGLGAAAIHGNKSQGARTRALEDFKQGKIRVLVATDIAARGLDIDQLPHVVNYELPQVPEDYVHRIGRTGRAGHDGHAISLVGSDEKPLLAAIEKLLRTRLPQETVTDFVPSATRAPSAATQAPRSERPRTDAPRRAPGDRREGGGQRTNAGANNRGNGANAQNPRRNRRGGAAARPGPQARA